jgi:hypothetical protein
VQTTGKWTKLRMILGSRQYYVGALGIILSMVMAVVIIYFWEDVLPLKTYGYAGWSYYSGSSANDADGICFR